MRKRIVAGIGVIACVLALAASAYALTAPATAKRVQLDTTVAAVAGPSQHFMALRPATTLGEGLLPVMRTPEASQALAMPRPATKVQVGTQIIWVCPIGSIHCALGVCLCY